MNNFWLSAPIVCLSICTGAAFAIEPAPRTQVPIATLGDEKALGALAESLDSADAAVKVGALNNLSRALPKNPQLVLQIAAQKGVVSEVCASGLIEAPAQIELTLLLASRAAVHETAKTGAVDKKVTQACLDRLEAAAKSLSTGKGKKSPNWAKVTYAVKKTAETGRFEPNVARVYARSEPKYGANGRIITLAQRGAVKIHSTASMSLGLGVEQTWVELKQAKKSGWVPLFDLCAVSVSTGSRERVMEQLKEYQALLSRPSPDALPELNNACFQWIGMELNAM
ncbi:MAG: hypothetical protein QE278_11955 [Limnobacter sp.]|nr:hypothetical protein [Limnobacter sp.]